MVRRIILLGLILWGVQTLLLPSIPLLRWLLDPLLLLLIFLGLTAASTRFLWAVGIGLGAMRDGVAGGPFGLYLCTFAFLGWIIGGIRHWMELEDPLIQGVWAGLLTGCAHGLAYAWLGLADPMIGWNRWGWVVIPLSMVSQGMVAFWGFPHLRRFLNSTW
jgi:cell shape-determining protein MreD